jgi:hypothetical protein
MIFLAEPCLVKSYDQYPGSLNYNTGLPYRMAVVRAIGVSGSSSAALRSMRWTAHWNLFFAATSRQPATAHHSGAL